MVMLWSIVMSMVNGGNGGHVVVMSMVNGVGHPMVMSMVVMLWSCCDNVNGQWCWSSNGHVNGGHVVVM